MAKVRNNIVIQGLSGTLGDQVTIKQDKVGRTIVGVKPTFSENRQFTEQQRAQQEKFKEATAYAKLAAQSEEAYPTRAEGTPQSAYNVPVADWFHTPEIGEIDLSEWTGQAGQAIRIEAQDDVRVTTQFSYNGDGARLRQMIAGVPTTYTQDLAAPLPVVLQSKTGAATTKYVYRLGTRPLAQNTTAWKYLRPDAFGSVRQIAAANGNVTLAKSYEPYDSVLNSSGTATSIFGYGGEQLDTTGLIYLQARSYSNLNRHTASAKKPSA